ncbi:MAG: hypothetical protein H7287_02915 [Thermoleophilia bacterium]|nr:hypothetical protein [Thermoleophilia bacterium]
MASSPAATKISPRPPAPLRVGSQPSVILADVISYGYAAGIVLATLQLDLQFTLLQGIGIMVLFVVLRGVALEIRKDARKQLLQEARRRAALRAQSPSRWTVEQRDGVGRRIDLGA